MVALLLALAAGAYVILVPGKLKALPMLSPSAFNGTNIKLSGDFKGVALVAFTDSPSGTCEECKTLNGVLKRSSKPQPLVEPLEWLGLQQTLKIGKVYCNGGDAHDELCTRFGVTGDDEPAAGVPALLYFKAGKHQGPYEGPRTPEAIRAWAKATAAAAE